MTPISPEYPLNDRKLMETVIHLISITLDEKRDKIKPDTPLFPGHAGFDSVGLLEFILRLEDTFRLRIPDEDLDLDIFYSPETIAAYLHARLKQDT